ncbi:hypothetical protein [Azospirillum doebereinerae]|uniref:Uncharacterized protein n=1 Tax=Azospirillum doebereinerae TaxID=92933 RepID=A0A433J761_9PROT|nr:hypothetical protein [Azospirillum doebereinerae]MCG5240745.1 hypothetical protein [Azospirillum doebereinerae]RUQ69234.1 hypothetical protein EJ913_15780 [Azospirillum doebereinerae]
MVISAEFLGLLLLITSAAALGLSIVIDVGRVSAEKTREAMTQRQYDKKRAALAEWRKKTEAKHAELTGLQAKLTEFNGRRHKAMTEARALELSKIELVHELGDPDGNTDLYWAQLTPAPNFPELDRKDIVFSRQIWEYRNVVHIAAYSADQAHGVVRASFGQRNGLAVSPVVPLAMAPDPEAETAAA